jgi:hypothetical protein
MPYNRVGTFHERWSVVYITEQEQMEFFRPLTRISYFDLRLHKQLEHPVSNAISKVPEYIM